MPKQLVLYKPNPLGNIEKMTYVDGVVVGAVPPKGLWENVWSFFYSHGATVGGNEWEAGYKAKDNGRVYDPATGNWNYTEAANGTANPC